MAAHGKRASGPAQPAPRPLKILLADDHAVFRSGMRVLLAARSRPAVVLETSDFDQTLDVARQHPDVDLVLLDLGMPGIAALGDIRALRECLPATPIVVVTASERRDDVLRCLDHGAAGYLPKSATPEEMQRALDLVLAGGIYAPPGLLRTGKAGDRPPADAVEAAVRRLTPRQLDVLTLLAAGKSNKEIATELGLSVATVKVHMMGVLRALNAQTRLEAVVLASGIANRLRR